MRIVGLTGGIATGKSTVARVLREMDVAVIDADAVAKELLQPGSPTLEQLVRVLGPSILDPSGALNRPRMRAAIASDPEMKAILDRITHPAIRTAIAERLVKLAEEGTADAVVEAALLVESGGHKLYPQLMVVSCDPERQLQRLMARDGMTEEDARALIATQMPLQEKERYATVVIRNDGTLEELEAATRSAWASLKDRELQ